MEISATLVKALRDRTGAGMMECKKALVETGGDIDAAVDAMRKAGLAKADKKAGRVAAEGLIGMETAADGRSGAMVEVNCETDFVAKEDGFRDFVGRLAARALQERPGDAEALLSLPVEAGGEKSVDVRRRELVAKIGENISVRRVACLDSPEGPLGAYVHGGRIGVLVALRGGTAETAKDLAMHVAASRPLCVGERDVPPELLEKEREILHAQAEASGKPAEIIDRMVGGRLKKFIGEITLLGQPFVKDPDTSVAGYLRAAGAEVVEFRRFEVGEGIEKKGGDFAAEVMAQVRGS